MKKFKAAIIVFPNVEELDFVGVWETLGTLEHFSEEYFEKHLVTIISDKIIKCAHGLTILADMKLTDLTDYDVIIVPGGPGVREAMKNEMLLTKIKCAYEAGKLISSVCTGAFILAKAGLLRGKRATTYHKQLKNLAQFNVKVLKQRVVAEENIITGAGVTASIDVGLKIIETILGKEKAKKVAEWIEYPFYHK
ncbi:MAG: DJ-1/PfpI family protein [archaeon GB-1867-035]|nr:DJ-1/PfpI family protein [Candidatus Culexmicrobium profundum]